MRIDMSPTDVYGDFKIRPGLFLENGASIVPSGVNFTIHSTGAKSCSLVLYHSHEAEPFAVIPFPESYRIGSVFAMIAFDLDYENLEYGFTSTAIIIFTVVMFSTKANVCLTRMQNSSAAEIFGALSRIGIIPSNIARK